MREYIVVFKKKGLPFQERNRVCAENRSKAIQTIREHYGKEAVEIIRAFLAENE